MIWPSAFYTMVYMLFGLPVIRCLNARRDSSQLTMGHGNIREYLAAPATGSTVVYVECAQVSIRATPGHCSLPINDRSGSGTPNHVSLKLLCYRAALIGLSYVSVTGDAYAIVYQVFEEISRPFRHAVVTK